MNETERIEAFNALPTMNEMPKPTRESVAKKEALGRERMDRARAFWSDVLEAQQRHRVKLVFDDDPMLDDAQEDLLIAYFDNETWWPVVFLEEWFEEEK